MKKTIAILSLLVVAASSAPEGTQDRTEVSRTPKLGLLGVNTLAQLAQELFARSTTSSQVRMITFHSKISRFCLALLSLTIVLTPPKFFQVLSLNLTNLVILLVVKALIFGAGSLGFGGHDHLGRSIDGSSENLTNNSPIFTESELLLMLGYLKGDLTDKYSCLNFAACQDPKKAKEYLMVSNLLVKGVNMFSL